MNEITVGQYLSRRLLQVGGPHIFGVPGDFNLTLLDEMLSVPDVRWVGNANELNGAYAADAYARTSRNIAALVTTFGVGELSAINGIAGSFAEDVPVIQITGMPRSSASANHLLLHHTLADGDYDHFSRAYAEVTAAQSILRRENAGDEIDRVLRAALEHSKPVYLGIPADVASAFIPASPLEHPLRPSSSSPLALADFRAALLQKTVGKRGLTVLAGALVHRRKLEHLLESIADHNGVLVATQPGAKAMLHEKHPSSIGTYMGDMSVSGATRTAVDDAPLLVLAGTTLSDLQTGMFSHKFDVRDAVELQLQHARVGAITYSDIRLEDSLRVLNEVVADQTFLPVEAPGLTVSRSEVFDDRRHELLTQRALWSIAETCLPENSVVIADSGTALMGVLELNLPRGTDLLAQPVWGSIGFTLPATLGTSLAAPGRRSILFIGDGAAQLTIQELATILYRDLHPIIVLINNDGYTIERMIQNPAAVYQDITPWNWTALPEAFAPDSGAVAVTTSTVGEFRDAFSEATRAVNRLVFIEAKLGALDSPPLLDALGRATARANRR